MGEHQLINAGTDANIANATVLAGLALAALSYLLSRRSAERSAAR